jgi:hypothetical protein
LGARALTLVTKPTRHRARLIHDAKNMGGKARERHYLSYEKAGNVKVRGFQVKVNLKRQGWFPYRPTQPSASLAVEA